MTNLTPKNPDFIADVTASFDRQPYMKTLGAVQGSVEPGRFVIELPFDASLTQQHGFLHAGVTSTMMDTACGFAAASLMPADSGVLTIEFKINLLAPGIGDHFRFVGQVQKPGRTITVCEGLAYGIQSGREKLIASMSATMMTVTDRQHIKG